MSILVEWDRPIFEMLDNDEELKKLQELWDDEKQDMVFPPFNFDEYDGFEGYKEFIKQQLETVQNIKL